jgi:ribosomal protein L11 methyltransferase
LSRPPNEPGTAADDEWLELATTVEPEAVEAISAVFAEFGQGVAIEQVVESSRDGDVVDLPADAPVLVKTYLPVRDATAEQRQASIEKAVWALGKLRQVAPLQVRRLREADWATAWKDYFFVHRVGERTVIVPSWRQADYEPRADDVVLLLDPGMAFGTGLHPTTRLCLRALEECVRPGMRVLDVGAGSGILAIAAARLGAQAVEAVEIDPVAASVCRDNVERNGVAEVVHVTSGPLEAAPPARYGLILANITIATLLRLHLLLADRLESGGIAVLSGVLAERADELLTVLGDAGWRHERTEQEQDWVAIIVSRG